MTSHKVTLGRVSARPDVLTDREKREGGYVVISVKPNVSTMPTTLLPLHKLVVQPVRLDEEEEGGGGSLYLEPILIFQNIFKIWGNL